MSFRGIAAGVLVALVACSSGKLGSGFGDDPKKPVDSGTGTGDNEGGDPGEEQDSGDIAAGDDSGSKGDAACAATSTKAQKAQVDIIFVIDTSESMDFEIAQVKSNINTFSTKIGQTGLDYRVIMLANRGTGTYAVCVPPPLGGANCADNPPLYYQVDQRIYSNDSFQLILSTYDGAKRWNDKVRMDATKVFIEITDDDPYASPTYQSFDQQLLAKAPAGMFGTAQNRKYVWDSIVGIQIGGVPVSTTKCPQAVTAGVPYQNLSNMTGGIVDSVCKTDYSAVLDNIAKGIIQKLGCEFSVPKPDGGTIDPTKVVVEYKDGASSKKLVQVTDASKCGQVADAWYYDNNTSPTKIVFCQSTCTQIGSSAGQIDVLLGCKGDDPR